MQRYLPIQINYSEKFAIPLGYIALTVDRTKFGKIFSQYGIYLWCKFLRLEYYTENQNAHTVIIYLYHLSCHAGVLQSHYHWITPIVKETCAEFGIKYNGADSFKDALSLHFSYLKKMGSGQSHPLQQEKQDG